ncbi:MAG: hypothetical protein KZQ91_20755, partial [Candidatus Thiodiazotropha sp. (ex Lucinoma borealis)]|nr:hypothetical protein [Candidatus Thiodiazotropha sp. (ex Lucinoma borealis)]
MEQKKTDNPSEIAFLGVGRIIRYSHENQVFPINIRMILGKSVSRIVHCFLNHFVAPGHGRMIPPKGFSTGEPVVPLNLVSPRQFQVVTEKESQCVDFLPELPFIDLRISPQMTQPGVNRRDGMFLESRVGMVINEYLDMSPIPRTRPLWNAKELQYITVFAPEMLNSWV